MTVPMLVLPTQVMPLAYLHFTTILAPVASLLVSNSAHFESFCRRDILCGVAGASALLIAQQPCLAIVDDPTARSAYVPPVRPTDEFTIEFDSTIPIGLTLKNLRVGFEYGTKDGTSRVIVAEVVSGGQADSANVEVDNIVVAVDGVDVQTEEAKQVPSTSFFQPHLTGFSPLTHVVACRCKHESRVQERRGGRLRLLSKMQQISIRG